ncbi:MAG: hypothetical protein M3O06_05280, partial [Pseudomonadota bacterium]|nr:hypothetical protein [Pseudomonadota bacterium]
MTLRMAVAAGTIGAYGAVAKTEPDAFAAGRAAAAYALAARRDSGSLAAAAALTFAAPARAKADASRAGAAALELAARASELAPDDPAIGWLYLTLCAGAPSCDFRDAATNLRWVDAENAAAWLPTLTAAERDKDVVQADRVLAAMAQGSRFDIYGNRLAVLV